MIHKVEIEGEGIHLNKSKWFGWSVVYPNKNEDGSWNYYNLITGGSIWKLIFVIIFMAILFGAIMEYRANMDICQKAVNIVNEYSLWNAMDYSYNWSLYDFNSEVTNES